MTEKEIVALVHTELAKYDSRFEDRLAIAIQRAFDLVLTEVQMRLNSLEEDVARLQHDVES